MSAAFGFAYTAGVLAAFNPCGFAMLPGWVGYFLATEDGQPHADLLARILRALWVAILLTAGFVIVFGAAGAIVNGGLFALNPVLPVIVIGLGGVLVAVGAVTLVDAQLPSLHTVPLRGVTRRRTARGMLAYGVGYGTATLSCVLPVFLVAVGASASASNNDRIAGIVGFTLGMGSVITLVSLAAGLFEGVAQRIRGASRVVTPLSGLLLVAAGAYIVHRELPLAAITLNRREPSANVTLELTAVGVIVSVAVGIVSSRVVGGTQRRTSAG